MILCRWHTNWFLSTGVNRDGGVIWLRAGPHMPHPEHFHPLPPAGAVLHGSVPLDSDSVFYPEVRYYGLKVYPEHWHQTSREPLLHCRIMGDQIAHATMTPEFLAARTALDHAAAERTVGAEDPLNIRWRELVGRAKAADAELRRRLVEEGWQDDADGLTRYVHVDELEKIEGYPPEGPF